jgi:antitoxin (DNA-binding transcriptional repressor) of toxin-antitoxin stability system
LKTHLSRLLAAVTAGEEVVIARGGRPIARLVRVEERTPVFGTLAGTIHLEPGWDAPLGEDELADWYGPVEPETAPAECKLLLDTHVVVWAATNAPTLSPRAGTDRRCGDGVLPE